MARKLVLNKGLFKKGVEGTGGIVAAIAKNLNISRESVYKFCRKNPDMELMRTRELEKVLDITENALFTKIKENDFKAIKFFLSTKGKTRGYAPKQEVELVAEVENNINTSLLTLCNDYNEQSSNSTKGSGPSKKE